MYKIDYNSYRSVAGFNQRVRFLVLHYTAENFAQSIASLAGQGGVSSHYLVPDETDETYKAANFRGVRLFNLVDEKDRAWHAGVSAWAGRNNLNDSSIGIEIVNLATDDDGVFSFPPYTEAQISALTELTRSILQRYPDITPVNVVGHSDIAVGRKSDPGAAFPWKTLYQNGVGAWYDDGTKERYTCRFRGTVPSRGDMIKALKTYGYDVQDALSNDAYYKNLIRAFQLHFRPSNYDGVLDAETAAIAYALVEKYFGKS